MAGLRNLKALRKLQKLTDRELDADRLFFERHPHRRYRVRLAYKNEEQQFRLMGLSLPTSLQLPGRPAVFIAVARVFDNAAASARIRAPICLPSHFDTDLTDEQAQNVFGWAAHPEVVAKLQAEDPRR